MKNKNVENLKEYMDQLFVDMDELFEKSKRYTKLEFITLLTIVVTIFASNFLIMIVAWNVWFFLFIFKTIKIDRPLNKKLGEIDGCFKTLELLGLFEKDPPSGGKKESKKSLLARLKETWGKIKWQPAPQLQT